MRNTPRTPTIAIGMLALLLACSACSKPEPPKKEQPPKPRAEHDTQLRDAIQAPIDKAKGVESQVLDAAQQQQADIDSQSGG